MIEGAENGPLKELRPPAVKKIQETHGDHGALIAIELRAEDAAEELEEAVEAGVDSRGRARAEPRVSKIGKFCNTFCKFLVGSFSAVSKRNFARNLTAISPQSRPRTRRFAKRMDIRDTAEVGGSRKPPRPPPAEKLTRTHPVGKTKSRK